MEIHIVCIPYGRRFTDSFFLSGSWQFSLSFLFYWAFFPMWRTVHRQFFLSGSWQFSLSFLFYWMFFPKFWKVYGRTGYCSCGGRLTRQFFLLRHSIPLRRCAGGTWPAATGTEYRRSCDPFLRAFSFTGAISHKLKKDWEKQPENCFPSPFLVCIYNRINLYIFYFYVLCTIQTSYMIYRSVS